MSWLGHEAILRRCCGVFAADEGADAWAKWTDDCGDGAFHLYDVGHGEAVLLVFVVPVALSATTLYRSST